MPAARLNKGSEDQKLGKLERALLGASFPEARSHKGQVIRAGVWVDPGEVARSTKMGKSRWKLALCNSFG